MLRRLPFVLAAALGGCAPALLDPAGPVAAGEKTLLINSLAVMLGIVIPVIVLTLAFAFWFRSGNGRAKHRPEFAYSGKLELLVWSVPLLVIIFLGGMGWIASHELDPRRPLAATRKPITIQVVALDWKWLFIYPEQGIATVNRVVVPAGTPVDFRITSATVMNSFFVPRLGSQIYAMAGMEAKLNLMADRPGRFHGLSAHYSGEGFSDMDFTVDAVPAQQFAGWAAKMRGRGPALTAASYHALARQKGNVTPFAYGSVPRGFFAAAVREAGAPVHETDNGGRES
ncbi:ubiquinol oxidase subunit II [Sphingomonas sp. RIT328]|uniref:ubiquinol oxidase subunit II n=1 Tax=Sphingomonas sp. RIT328 TaxID=1470591 RepID=UPI000448E0A0|nr:ubiquinol oxidase subunit II [Sphingomonas sp. RIT328]EZP48856.1 Ubiquinol oxidase, subunit II [Sphingomonas sp. RIT328]